MANFPNAIVARPQCTGRHTFVLAPRHVRKLADIADGRYVETGSLCYPIVLYQNTTPPPKAGGWMEGKVCRYHRRPSLALLTFILYHFLSRFVNQSDNRLVVAHAGDQADFFRHVLF